MMLLRHENNVSVTFIPKAGKSVKGRHNQQRKKVLDAYASALNGLANQAGGASKRNIERLIRQWNKCVWEVLEEVPVAIGKDDPPIYFFDNTAGSRNEKPNVKEDNAIFENVSDVKHILDGVEYDGKTIMILSSDGRLIACKCGDDDKAQITPNKWAKKYLHALIKAMNLQINLARGARKKGVSESYVCFGVRKDPKGTELGRYATRKNIARKTIKKLNQMMTEFVKDIELYALNYIPAVDHSVLNQLRDQENLPMLTKENGKFMQMAIGRKYWSPVHIDDDVWYTALSGYSASTMRKEGGKNEILFYFLFPSVNVAIPMRSMDLLVFNSSFPHCASNYRIGDTFIFSFFSSSKATLTHMADNQDKKEELVDVNERT